MTPTASEPARRLDHRAGRRAPGLWLAALVGLLVALLSAGCAPGVRPGQPLRVGVTPNNPPLVSRLGSAIIGLEADLAQRLASELGRPIRFVELPWSRQVPALLAGETDIIMSGMSVTPRRARQVAFTEPYLRVGQMALTRPALIADFAALEAVLTTTARVGVERDTTAADFARRQMPGAQVVELLNVRLAVQALRAGDLELVLHDAPVVLELARQYPGEVAVPNRVLLTNEYLAWATRPEDKGLRAAANRILARWERDGTLAAAIARWSPQLARLSQSR